MISSPILFRRGSFFFFFLSRMQQISYNAHDLRI
uniref:Uncharacterized protein n=1 Tax=Anguilla anguilla TaxID=7936 RepID=A0A0E9SJA9_ANGAN